MKKYDFTKESINEMYDNVCDESIEKISSVMKEINSTDDPITKEQNEKFEKVYDSIAINITVGNHTITIPGNADYIELLFGMIENCKNETM